MQLTIMPHALERLRSSSTVALGVAAAVVWRLYRLQKALPKQCPVVRGHWLWGAWPAYFEAHVKKTQLEFIHDLFMKLGKTFVLWHPLADHIVMTMDRRNVEYMLKGNFENFQKGPVFRGRNRDLLGDGIFNADGENWYHQRKTTSHMFTTKLFKEHIWAVVRRNAKKVRSILEAVEVECQVDVFSVMNRFTLDSIGEIGFAKSVGSLEDPSSPFLGAFDRAQQNVLFRDLNPLWPVMRFLSVGREGALKHDISLLRAYSRTVVRELSSAIEAREENTEGSVVLANADASKSFVGLFLLDARKRGEQLTEERLCDIVLNFLLAGRDTTAQGLAWTWYHLANHPEVEAKVRKEIADVCRGCEVRYEDLRSFPYMTAVINESMRLSPSVPIDGKMNLKADTLPDGTVLPPGTGVLYVINSQNRDTDLWGADAAVFRPERWLEMTAPPDSYTYPVFNAGPRECLGKRLAMVEMQALIAMVLPHVSLQLAVPAEEITYDAQLTLGMASGLPCYVERLDCRHGGDDSEHVATRVSRN